MNPLVSILCITFNHEKFIASAIDSFLSQKTNFDIEIIIYDDASTDRTAEIIKEYEIEYPGIFYVFYQNENQYSKGVRALNFIYNVPRARGRYVAICEGDDYWTDPLKLQKQFDFLESNLYYVAAVHSVDLEFEKGFKTSRLSYNFDCDFDLSMLKILKEGGGVYPTCSLFARLDSLKITKIESDEIARDFIMIINLRLLGRIRFMSDKMACYRIHSGGVYQSVSNFSNKILENRFSNLKFIVSLYKKFPLEHFPSLVYSNLFIMATYVYLRLKFLNKS